MAGDDDGREASLEAETGFEALLRDDRAAPREPPAAGGDAGLPSVGEVLDGKYRIDAPLGEGGMGAVYRATHVGTGRSVALKVLVPELTSNAAAIERFQREAKAAGAMRHPNIVDVTDFGFAEREGRRVAYLVMELLEGETLRALLARDKQLPLGTAVDVLGQICSAVAEAHGRGILHRDLKPENIHVARRAGRYQVKVLDFGIAKLVEPGQGEEDAAAPERDEAPEAPASFAHAATVPASMRTGRSLTRLGARIGTPRYMSPEQWRGDAVDERSDVYALGVMAYEVLAGRPLVDDEGRRRTAWGEGLPAGIVDAVNAALTEDPRARPPSAAALAAALQGGAETTWTLLKRSFAFAVEHYGYCFRASVIVLGVVSPFVAISVICEAADFFHKGNSQLLHGLTVGAGTAGALAVFAIWPAITGRFAAIVARTASDPSLARPVPPLNLRRTMVAAIPSTLAIIALLLATAAAALVPVFLLGRLGVKLPIAELVLASSVVVLATTVVITPFSLYTHVIFVEGASGLAPLRRSSTLVRPMRRAAFGVLLVWAAVAQVPPLVISVLLQIAIRLAPESTVSLALMLATQCAPWIVSTLCAPFSMVPGAMLYLQAREAEGRPYRVEA